MSMQEFGELLLQITTSEQAAGVAASVVIGLFLKYIPDMSNFQKGVFSIGVNLLVAPAALGLRGLLYDEPFTADNVRTSVFTGIACAWAAYLLWKQGLEAAANRVETKKIEAVIEQHTPISYEVELPPHAVLEAQAKAQVDARPVATTTTTITTTPPAMTPMYLNPLEETNAIDPYLADTGVMAQPTNETLNQAALKGYWFTDEQGEPYFVQADDPNASWVKPVPAVSAKVISPKGVVRGPEAMKAAIEGKDTPEG